MPYPGYSPRTARSTTHTATGKMPAIVLVGRTPAIVAIPQAARTTIATPRPPARARRRRRSRPDWRSSAGSFAHPAARTVAGYPDKVAVGPNPCLYCEFYEPRKGEHGMADQPHGRYYAQELAVDQNANVMEQIQSALDEGDHHDWHLVGVSDVMAERGVILFWDTERPSCGISHRQ